ncbi:hypothetical protein JXA05_01170, partial [Candidatus Peregrinibacteria bacterium]|nr:hypothetical protein [Candidatus Peregrinibacteria bacterium]
MKTKNILIILFAALAFPAGVFALSAPTVDSVPESVNADVYTLKIHTEQGAKVTVVGGPSDLAPVTDGADGDALDGVVQVMVG